MNHDITHCNNQECKKHDKCYRFVALKALKEENSKLPIEQQTNLVSMFENTNENCIKKDYKFFMEYESKRTQ